MCVFRPSRSVRQADLERSSERTSQKNARSKEVAGNYSDAERAKGKIEIVLKALVAAAAAMSASLRRMFIDDHFAPIAYWRDGTGRSSLTRPTVCFIFFPRTLFPATCNSILFFHSFRDESDVR